MTPQDRQNQAWQAYQNGFSHAGQNAWDSALPLFAKALSLHSNNVRFALFLGAALWHTDKKQSALQLWSLAADHDPMLRIAQYQPQADPLTRQTSQLADLKLREFMTGLQASAISNVEHPGRISTAIWPQTHAGPVDYVDGGAKPYMFFAKDLPETPVFDRKTTFWTKDLEARTPAIRNEYINLMETHSGAHPVGEPYVEAQSNPGEGWDHLKGQMDWTSIHIFKYGEPQAAAKACPATCEALNSLPLVMHNGNPMEVFFSVLKPGTHIPPHYGLANCRTTVHLPLIIPDNCAIRVQNTEHSWVEGETFIFDDSFNHEAWNRSDETRVVLIFEAWRPDMTEGEILAVEESYKARSMWTENRKMPNLEAIY